jgi:uncharacterized protein YdhG (YjbR/CyaY superfamily)
LQALTLLPWLALQPIAGGRYHDRFGRRRAVAPRAGRNEPGGSPVAEQLATIDQYISSFPEDVQVILEAVRRSIRNVVPAAGEMISYRIPAMTLNGRPLVYFAAWKHHIAVYPVPEADEALGQELAQYLAAKGTARFPLRAPVPYDLIERLVELLVQQRGGQRE